MKGRVEKKQEGNKTVREALIIARMTAERNILTIQLLHATLRRGYGTHSK